MNMKVCKYLALTALLFAATVPAYAGDKSTKEEYELQERCGKQAADVFKKEFRDGIIQSEPKLLNAYSGHYKNHYNRKLNKCFLLVEDYVDGTVRTMRLKDIQENNLFGTFAGDTVKGRPEPACMVLGKICHSEAEWNSLIAPYMNE